jgi:hypothetical protein
LSIGLESTSNSARSIAVLKRIVELNLLNWHFSVSIWLGSVVWLKIGLSESGAPLLVKSLMRSKFCGCTVSSEEIWASFIKSLLIRHEAKRKNESLFETYLVLLNLSWPF